MLRPGRTLIAACLAAAVGTVWYPATSEGTRVSSDATAATKTYVRVFQNQRGYRYRLNVNLDLPVGRYLSFALGDPGRLTMQFPRYHAVGTSFLVTNLTKTRPAPIFEQCNYLLMKAWWKIPQRLRASRDRLFPNLPNNQRTPTNVGMSIPYGYPGPNPCPYPTQTLSAGIGQTVRAQYFSSLSGAWFGPVDIDTIPERDRRAWKAVLSTRPAFVAVFGPMSRVLGVENNHPVPDGRTNRSGGLVLRSEDFRCAISRGFEGHMGAYAAFTGAGRALDLKGSGCVTLARLLKSQFVWGAALP